jgi:hypothetical protein
MAYRDFTLSDLKEQFNLELNEAILFPSIVPVNPSELLINELQRNRKNAVLGTEKIVSEAILFPILLETKINNKAKISLFSGEKIIADKSKKLSGTIDFIFTKGENDIDIYSPILFSLHQAKLSASILKGYNQAISQLIGCQVFNDKFNLPKQIYFAGVSNGNQWRFFKLENNILTFDNTDYNTQNLPQLLGVLQKIVDFYH